MVKQSVKKVFQDFLSGKFFKNYVKVSVGVCTSRSSKELSPETGWRASRPPLWQESGEVHSCLNLVFSEEKKNENFNLGLIFEI